MEIGRRIISNKITGEVLKDSGERSGDVRTTTIQQDFPGFDPATMDVIELQYGERSGEFKSFGSFEVNTATKQLIIYPHLSVVLDKQQIHATGLDAAQLTVSVPDPGADVESIKVTVDGKTYDLPLIGGQGGGQASFQFTSAVEGTYQLLISSLKHGSAVSVVEVVP